MLSKIETERLLMREIKHADIDGMFELDSDPAVLKYIGIPTIQTKEESSKLIEELQSQYRENGIGRWSILLKETNEFIGWSGIKFYKTPINNHTNFYELGYRFIQKHWKKGYATETARAWLKYGFETLGANEIFAMTELEHTASIHVLEKVGFTNIEIFDYFGEELFWFRITKKEWKNDKRV